MMAPDNVVQDVRSNTSYTSSQEMNTHLSTMSIQEETPPPPVASTTAPPVEQEYRPLNVKDALTYLDKVKAKFTSHSNVYNQFLDIMKDFKSQNLDTPGVIERVSTLFRGHPTLISGFNTFLPPGYCIECSVDEQERNVIKVTTPTGTTCITDSEALDLRGQAVDKPSNSTNKAPVEFNHAITYVNKIKSRYASQPETYKKFLEILQTYQKDQKPIQEVYAEVQTLFDGSKELLDEFKQFLPDPNKQRNKKRLGNIPTLSISKRTKHHHKTLDVQTSDVRSETNDDESTKDLALPTFSAEEAEFFQKVKTYIGNKATYNAFLKVLNLFSQQIVDQNILVNRVESFIGGHAELFDWFKQLVGFEEVEPEEEEDSHPKTLHMSNCSRPQLKASDNEATGCGPSYRRIANKSWQDRSCSGRDALCWDVLNDSYISHPTLASEDTGYVAAKKNQYEEALHRVEEERYDYDLNIEANLNAMAVLEPIVKKLSAMSPEEKASFRLSEDQLASTSTLYRRILKKIYGATKGLEMIDLLYTNPSQAVPIVLRRLKQKDDEWKRAQREWNKIWREVERKNFWKSLDYQGITFKINDRKAMTAKMLVAEAERPQLEQGPFVMNDTGVFKDVARLLYFYLTKQPVYNPEDCLAMRVFLQQFCSTFFDVTDVEPSTAEDIVVEDVGVDDDASSVLSDNTTTTTTAMKSTASARSSRRGRRGRGQLNDNDSDGKLRKDVLTRNLNSSKKKSSYSEDDDDEDNDDDDDEDDDLEEDEDENDSQLSNMTKEDNSTNLSGDDDEDEDENDEDEDDNDTNRRRLRRRRAAARRNSSKRFPRQRLTKITKKLATATAPPKLGALIDKAEKSMMEVDDDMQKTYNFFGNNSFYCFFRLYQILYERLLKMKLLDAEFRNDPQKSKKAYEEARDLGITPKRFKALKMDTKRGHYHILLSLIDKFFEGYVDQQVFEECVRYIFGAEAHIMFTIDKLVLSIVRHVHIVITDSQSQELYELFKVENRAERMDQDDVTTYRTRVAGTIDSTENTYHITFKLKSRTMSIRLLDNNSNHTPSHQIIDEGCGGYDEYVANYIDWANETKGINQLSLTPRFLKRNLKHKEHPIKEIAVRSGMQYKICRDSYHMFYIIGTEDAFVRRGLARTQSTTFTHNPKWNQWLDTHCNQGLTEQEVSQAEQEALSILQ